MAKLPKFKGTIVNMVSALKSKLTTHDVRTARKRVVIIAGHTINEHLEERCGPSLCLFTR